MSPEALKLLAEPGALWWAKSVFHNCIIHPVLPLADALQRLGLKRLPQAVYHLHDNYGPWGGG